MKRICGQIPSIKLSSVIADIGITALHCTAQHCVMRCCAFPSLERIAKNHLSNLRIKKSHWIRFNVFYLQFELSDSPAALKMNRIVRIVTWHF
jgi:hypothetical protein